jgi:hypothetical protein
VIEIVVGVVKKEPQLPIGRAQQNLAQHDHVFVLQLPQELQCPRKQRCISDKEERGEGRRVQSNWNAAKHTVSSRMAA